MPEGPTARYAIGTFDTWQATQAALDDLRRRGVDPGAVSFLGLRRVMVDRTPATQSELRELPFPSSREPVCCTAGLLAEWFLERMRQGAGALEDALRYGLLPRHASTLQEAVDGGRVLLWVQLFDSQDERRACNGLLAHSSEAVAVHDLAPGSPTGGDWLQQ